MISGLARSRLSVLKSTILFIYLMIGSSNHFPTKSISPTVLDAIERCNAAVLKKPANDEKPSGPSYCLGRIYQSLGDYSGAIKSYEIAFSKCKDGNSTFHIGKIDRMLRNEFRITLKVIAR